MILIVSRVAQSHADPLIPPGHTGNASSLQAWTESLPGASLPAIVGPTVCIPNADSEEDTRALPFVAKRAAAATLSERPLEVLLLGDGEREVPRAQRPVGGLAGVEGREGGGGRVAPVRLIDHEGALEQFRFGQDHGAVGAAGEDVR